jgi:hypothetical protein
MTAAWQEGSGQVARERDSGGPQRDDRSAHQAQARHQAAAQEQARRLAHLQALARAQAMRAAQRVPPRSAAAYRAIADRRLRDERERPKWCHAVREHLAATDDQLGERARTGKNVREQLGHDKEQKRIPPDHATRWLDKESLGRAVDQLENSDVFRDKLRKKEEYLKAHPGNMAAITVREKLSVVLGPDWRQHVSGRSKDSGGQQASQWRSDSEAVATWIHRPDGRWYLQTCYPAVRPATAGP